MIFFVDIHHEEKDRREKQTKTAQGNKTIEVRAFFFF